MGYENQLVTYYVLKKKRNIYYAIACNPNEYGSYSA